MIPKALVVRLEIKAISNQKIRESPVLQGRDIWGLLILKVKGFLILDRSLASNIRKYTSPLIGRVIFLTLENIPLQEAFTRICIGDACGPDGSRVALGLLKRATSG
jgi:hypothetical protein